MSGQGAKRPAGRSLLRGRCGCGAQPRVTSRGTSLVEIAIAFLVLSLAVVPLVGLFTGGRSQAAMSEHQIYAELAAYRAQEDHATRHFGWLWRERTAVRNQNIFPTLQGFDLTDGQENGWLAQLPEFQKNAWKSQAPLEGNITHEPGPEDGRGLMIVKSSAKWKDLTAGGTRTKEYQYHLLRLRAKRDYGLRSNDAEL